VKRVLLDENLPHLLVPESASSPPIAPAVSFKLLNRKQ